MADRMPSEPPTGSIGMRTLAEIRDDVLREWTNEKRQEMETAQMTALLDRYDVRIDAGHANGAAP